LQKHKTLQMDATVKVYPVARGFPTGFAKTGRNREKLFPSPLFKYLLGFLKFFPRELANPMFSSRSLPCNPGDIVSAIIFPQDPGIAAKRGNP
jgi:hypothetical protein